MKNINIKMVLNFFIFIIIGAILVVIENNSLENIKTISIPITMSLYFGIVYLGFFYLRIHECRILGTIMITIFFGCPIIIYAYMIFEKYISLEFGMVKWIFYYIALYISASYYGKIVEKWKYEEEQK